jgi:short-chain Z-isoprenyl diphosphate synthase
VSVLGARLLQPLSAAYTRRLRQCVRQRRVPAHVAVILDGNRRCAERAGLCDPGAGDRRGADKIDELLDWCAALGIREVTIWGLSNENLERPARELQALLAVIADKPEALGRRARDPATALRIRVIGRIDDLPSSFRETARRLATQAAPPEAMTLNVAVGNSGRDELIDACRSLVLSLAEAGLPAEQIASRVTRESLAARLYTAGAPDPDLIIRTSGEQRLSGFLPWQSAHSELYFAEAPWPAFRELDLLRALRTFQLRQRRFGT